MAYLDPSIRDELEQENIYNIYDVDHVREEKTVEDHTSIEGLDVEPPKVVEYFVRLKPEVVNGFVQKQGMEGVSKRIVEDELVYQNSYKLNTTYYESTGDKRAFVLSHGKNMLVLKMVGYGDDVIRYYKLEDIHAHVWIGHHRYPTKGRVWHPGGAHPFIGLNEALVHNGDFANHASISEYLAQRNVFPLFLTDTEVAAQVFDLLHRTYAYPLEYTIEALAPTTERDFSLLPEEKQKIYRMLQTTHMSASPDGPWFFLIAQSDTHGDNGPMYRLLGITDTSMLRPQVFAVQESNLEDGSKISIGLAASEKQGIDAALSSLSESDSRFWSKADKYWNARGGSYTDGGSFLFTVSPGSDGKMALNITDKFGAEVNVHSSTNAYYPNGNSESMRKTDYPSGSHEELFEWVKTEIKTWEYEDVVGFIRENEERADSADLVIETINLLILLIDQRYFIGNLRRSSLLSLFEKSLNSILEKLKDNNTDGFLYLISGDELPIIGKPNQLVLIDARGYKAEGENSIAREIQRLYEIGFRKYIVAFARGHRFIGNGLSVNSPDIEIDVFGSSGDYLASGLDGGIIRVHNNAQDQLAQIMKSGELVVYGDVGQTFMYGAKGGEAYILGNAAGRPLINAVGKPRVVINGTCLDYLAESFMAGDPLNGGGFVVLNGLMFNEDNDIVDLLSPYPGGNLFSLASGGAIYIRDPKNILSEDQLNGGEFVGLSDQDWALIKPYLEKNFNYFNITIDRLLTVGGKLLSPSMVYRKIQPVKNRALQAEEVWVTKGDH